MSTPNFIETDHSTLGAAIHGEAQKRGVAAMSRYIDDAHVAATGIETIVGLLRRDALEKDFQDETNAPALSAYDIDSLLGIVQFAAKALCGHTYRVKTWADEHFVGEGEQ